MSRLAITRRLPPPFGGDKALPGLPVSPVPEHSTVRAAHLPARSGNNNLGQIVGTGTVSGNDLDHALLWTGSARIQRRPQACRPASPIGMTAPGATSSILGLGDDGSTTSGAVSAAGVVPGISPHVYKEPGTFRAALSLTDAKGATGSSSNVTIKVR